MQPPPSDRAAPKPKGLRYGSQGPVTISLGALPSSSAPPIAPRPEQAAFAPPAARRDSRSAVLNGSLLPLAPVARGALPQRPTPAPVAAAEPPAAPIPVPAAAQPEPQPVPPVEPPATVSVARRPSRDKRPVYAAAACVALAVVAGAVWLSRPQASDEAATVASATPDADRIRTPDNLLPSETPDPTDLVGATTREPATRPTPVLAGAASAVPVAARAEAATAASTIAPIRLNADARTPEAAPPVARLSFDSARPALASASEVPQTLPLVAPPPVFAPAPIVPATPRPTADPDAPVSTAPPGLSPE